MKKLIFTTIVLFAIISPLKSNARIIQGWAVITMNGNNSYTLSCTQAVPGVCCTINGNVITINHWSGVIVALLEISLPPVLPTNFPIPFTTEEEIQHD